MTDNSWRRRWRERAELRTGDGMRDEALGQSVALAATSSLPAVPRSSPLPNHTLTFRSCCSTIAAKRARPASRILGRRRRSSALCPPRCNLQTRAAVAPVQPSACTRLPAPDNHQCARCVPVRRCCRVTLCAQAQPGWRRPVGEGVYLHRVADSRPLERDMPPETAGAKAYLSPC